MTERTQISPAGINNFEVRLAQSPWEIEAAQRLRYRAFYQGTGLSPGGHVKRAWQDLERRDSANRDPANRDCANRDCANRDCDRFDEYCDHLLVIDRSACASSPSGAGTPSGMGSSGVAPSVVGTYRLLRRSVADTCGGFYSASEFDLSPLANYPGEIVELGRSCVDARYRGKAVMQRLWGGLAAYAKVHDIGLMFGCASFPGTDPAQMAAALSYLRHHHAAPKSWRPKALPGRHVEMKILKKHHLDTRQALREMPPLIKGYLRVGGVVGEGAVIDHDFNTVDACLLVETGNVTGRYRRHYLDGDAAAIPAF